MVLEAQEDGWGDSHSALQWAAEPLDVIPGWVSKPQNRGFFLAPFGVCECLVIPSALLTRRAHMSQNHEVRWQCRFFSRSDLQPSRRAALFSGPACPCWGVPVTRLAPTPHLSRCWFSPLTPAPMMVVEMVKQQALRAGTYWDVCAPVPVASLLWAEGHNLQSLFVEKAKKKSIIKALRCKAFPFFNRLSLS